MEPVTRTNRFKKNSRAAHEAVKRVLDTQKPAYLCYAPQEE